MELKNIDKAKELIAQYDALKRAKSMLSEDTSCVIVRDENHFELMLPKSVKMNVLNVINCEYEHTREEVRGL